MASHSVLCLLAFLFLAETTSLSLPTPASVLKDLSIANSYFISQPGNAPKASSDDCGWTRGTFMSGHMAHYSVSHDSSLLDWGNRWAAVHNWTCDNNWKDANFYACGQAYASLYHTAPADYKLALAITMDHAVQAYTGYDWFWVDALFMGMSSFFQYSNLTGDDRLLTLAWAEYNATTYGGTNRTSQPGLWDPESNLYWRDKSYISLRTPSGAKVFWARGCGWAIASMALSIAALPAGHPAAAEFTVRLQAMAAALVPQQGADGLWRASLLDAAQYPNPETTGTACFTFALAWAVNHGILAADTYVPVIARAWAGLSSVSLQSSGLVGWCQPANGQPAPTTADATSDFCVGQFLLAGSEVYRLVTAQSTH